jgi:hypothetical protein
MRAEQVSPLPPGRGGTWAAGLALHGGPDAAGPLAATAAIDVTAGHLPAGIAARASAFTRGDTGVPRAGGKNLTPGTSARNPRPLDPDPLHLCHLLGRSLRGRADGEPARLWDRFFGDGTSTRPG